MPTLWSPFSAMAATSLPSSVVPDVELLRVVERHDHRPEQTRQLLTLWSGEVRQNRLFLGEQVNERAISNLCPLVCESHQHASAVSRVRMALDKTATGESVDPIRHGSRSDERLLEQLPW